MRSLPPIVVALLATAAPAHAAETLPTADELAARIVKVRGQLDTDRAAMLHATPMAKRYGAGLHALAILGLGVDVGVSDVTSGAARRPYLSCALSFKLGAGIGVGVQVGRERELGAPGMRCGEVLPAVRTKRHAFFAIGGGIAATGGKADERTSPIASRQGFVGVGVGMSQDTSLRLHIPLWKTGRSKAGRWITEAASALDAAKTALDAGDRAAATERLQRASFLRGRITEALDPKPVDDVRRFSL